VAPLMHGIKMASLQGKIKIMHNNIHVSSMRVSSVYSRPTIPNKRQTTI
jgi:hypothetical protein